MKSFHSHAKDWLNGEKRVMMKNKRGNASPPDSGGQSSDGVEIDG